jgi:hypothetical protein
MSVTPEITIVQEAGVQVVRALEPGSVWIVEEGTPESSDGKIGDLYLDKATGFVYGPKTTSGWSATPALGIKEETSVRGQASRITSGSITGVTQGVYQSTGLTATFDASAAAGMSLGTTDGFALKNTSGSSKLFRFYGSIDAVTANNETLGIKLAKNGTAINETECRAFKAAGAAEAKLVTSWMIEMNNNDEVALFITNHSSNSNITLNRARLLASEVK